MSWPAVCVRTHIIHAGVLSSRRCEPSQEVDLDGAESVAEIIAERVRDQVGWGALRVVVIEYRGSSGAERRFAITLRCSGGLPL